MESSWDRFISIIMTCIIGVNCISATVSGYTKEHHDIVDFSQAELMLNFLRAVAEGTATQGEVDSILAAHGTQLIIQQQNISRKVTQIQYRDLLSNLGNEQWPDITAPDETERARRGIMGLKNDVWPSLRWGILHTELLQRRISALGEIYISEAAKSMAKKFLPKPVPLQSHLSVVMGGRAGAAALEGDDIYFDVLIFSYRDSQQRIHFPSPEEVTEFFAHEIHHLGMHQLISEIQGSLNLSVSEKQAFRFLTFLVMEGSASYLINGHRNIEMMANNPEFAAYMATPDQILEACDKVLKTIFGSELDDEAYEKELIPFAGTGYHAAGAMMLSVIDQAGGLDAVMTVLIDPRKLPVIYNESIIALPRGPKRTIPIDSELAKRISTIGE